VGNYLFTSLGIGAGYHRLLTHRGFKCPRWFEYILTTLGVCSFQDSPARWVLVHRVHHQHSDHQPDPHTPRVSAFWSHMGWLFIDNRDLSTASAYDRYCRDLMRDPYYLWLQRGLNWVWVYVAHGVLITLIGLLVGWLMYGTLAATIQVGAQWLLWGVVFRTIFTWHVTWGINSASNIWGYRNYETREDSRNNWLFALLTNGEGWHNNHHADPRSARHGHRWWEVDVTWWSLRLFERIGLVRDLVHPNQSALDRKAS
jgi:stearoyl-CoA desaturase (delta-9 desaturase)